MIPDGWRRCIPVPLNSPSERGVPVIPCRLVGTGHVFGLLWRRERLDVWVGDPIVPDSAMTRHHAARAMMAQASAQFEGLSRRHP